MKIISIVREGLRSFRNELTTPETLLRDSVTIVQGALIQAAGYTLFLIPNKIIPGGLYGIGTVLYHLWGVPVGTSVLVMNVPLLVLGTRLLGPRFGIRTVAAIFLTAAFTDAIIYLFGVPNLTDDLMLQSVIGGIIVGYGTSRIFKTGATTGGVDIVGQIANARFKLSIGRIIFFVNVTIIGIGVIALGDPSMVIYSVVSVFAISKVLDASLEGVSFYKGLIIISEKHNLVREQVTRVIQREIYTMNGQDNGREMLFTALTRRETTFLKDFVKAIDPGAVVLVFNAQEFIGTTLLKRRARLPAGDT